MFQLRNLRQCRALLWDDATTGLVIFKAVFSWFGFTVVTETGESHSFFESFTDAKPESLLASCFDGEARIFRITGIRPNLLILEGE